MQNTRTKIQVLLMTASLGLLAACASTQSNSNAVLAANSIAASPLLPASSFALLTAANSGDQLQLPESPWGSPAQVTVQDRYFSASNRLCLTLQLTSGAQPQNALVCRNEAEQWYQGRALAF